jgi:hypothetical protein
MTKRKKEKKRKPVHEDLEGFEISVNPFGELESSLDIDKINTFLNENLEDKKLQPPDADEEE